MEGGRDAAQVSPAARLGRGQGRGGRLPVTRCLDDLTLVHYLDRYDKLAREQNLLQDKKRAYEKSLAEPAGYRRPRALVSLAQWRAVEGDSRPGEDQEPTVWL